MFARFTDEARRVFIAAEEQARADGSEMVDPRHLMVALLTKSLVGEAVGRTGCDVDAVVVQVMGSHAGSGSSEVVTPSQKTLDLFRQAEKTAEDLGHMAVTSQDLFLAVTDNEGEPSVQALCEHGDLDRMRQEVTSSIPSEPSSDGENCERCGAPTSSKGQVREIDLSVEGHDPIRVFAYFCGVCGSTYGLVKAPHEGEEAP